MSEKNKNINMEEENKVDWKREILKSLKIGGRVLYKSLSYVISALLTILLIVFITGIIVGTAFAFYITNYVDTELDIGLVNEASGDKTTRLYYTDYDESGAEITKEIEDERIYSSDNSIWVSYENIPKTLQEAFIAIEDHRFWTHKGVDWIPTVKAVANYFLKVDRVFGASTITQQLVKNLTQDDEVKIQRKVQEILRAINLEKELSKEEILELYLNVIYFGNNCYGVTTAAETYFGKELSELTIAECASLAAIVKNPSGYDPLYHPDINKERRMDVIWAMCNYGLISESERDAAYEEEIKVIGLDVDDDKPSTDANHIFSWYTESLFNEVRNDLVEQYGYTEYVASLLIYTGGLQIYSCMDKEVQDTLEEVYENSEEYFPKSSDTLQPQSAMVIIDPYNGNVLGLVGGRDKKIQNRILNRATQAKRPSGSSIKPLSVYAPALDMGVIEFGSIYDDSPVSTNEKTGAPWPANYPAGYRGPTTINSAIERSVNTIAVRVLQDITTEYSYNFLIEKLGFKSLIEADCDLAPLALGQFTWGVTVLEMTAGYTMFTNNGVYNHPRLYTKVLDSEGKVLLTKNPDSEIVISEQSAAIMTKMLKNVMNNGTGTSVTLRHSVDTAGKTGTTTADFDRWFVGYTPYYIGGTWVGYDNNIALSKFGPNPACDIWNVVMTKLHQKYIDRAASGEEALKTFNDAPGVVELVYCRDSGKLANENCVLEGRALTGYYSVERAPTEYCGIHSSGHDTETGDESTKTDD